MTPFLYDFPMTTYRDSGVDVAKGDAASKAAYGHAASTFEQRKGLVGAPVFEEGGFAGLLDMGDFFLVQTTDGTGTKIDLAFDTGKLRTLGYDLLAMVADDAVCTGAEVISVSNCIDMPKVDAAVIDALLAGLADACRKQKIVIPAGEIAEVLGAVTRCVWSATAIGIVTKDRVITPKTIRAGDAVIALRESGMRSNGFSLIRSVLTTAFGDQWHTKLWKDGQTWGEVMLTPSTVYHGAILSLIGRFGEKRAVNLKGIAHITGGGIPSKFRRILKPTGLGAVLHDLWEPHEALRDLMRMGSVDGGEAYRTWSMGNGMLIVLASSDTDAAIHLLSANGIEAKVCGEITKEPEITIAAPAGILRF